jgi:hypothetical protein
MLLDHYDALTAQIDRLSAYTFTCRLAYGLTCRSAEASAPVRLS